MPDWHLCEDFCCFCVMDSCGGCGHCTSDVTHHVMFYADGTALTGSSFREIRPKGTFFVPRPRRYRYQLGELRTGPLGLERPLEFTQDDVEHAAEKVYVGTLFSTESDIGLYVEIPGLRMSACPLSLPARYGQDVRRFRMQKWQDMFAWAVDYAREYWAVDYARKYFADELEDCSDELEDWGDEKQTRLQAKQKRLQAKAQEKRKRLHAKQNRLQAESRLHKKQASCVRQRGRRLLLSAGDLGEANINW